jgi:nucleotide-binding universal stress UspA family protein
MSTKLLVAVDFSPLSLRAVEYAVEYVRGSSRTIDLLHVTQDPIPAHAASHAPAELLEQIREGEQSRASNELDAIMETIPTMHRGRQIVRRGPPAETICEEAAKDYDLVVVSTHGRTGFSQFFIGSVAERVVRLSPIPVLVVR